MDSSHCFLLGHSRCIFQGAQKCTGSQTVCTLNTACAALNLDGDGTTELNTKGVYYAATYAPSSTYYSLSNTNGVICDPTTPITQRCNAPCIQVRINIPNGRCLVWSGLFWQLAASNTSM